MNEQVRSTLDSLSDDVILSLWLWMATTTYASVFRQLTHYASSRCLIDEAQNKLDRAVKFSG